MFKRILNQLRTIIWDIEDPEVFLKIDDDHDDVEKGIDDNSFIV